MGDEEMDEARSWVNYKHFSETVPDILSLSEYVWILFIRKQLKRMLNHTNGFQNDI